jgi:hypothetical protein
MLSSLNRRRRDPGASPGRGSPGRGELFLADRGGKVGFWASAGYRDEASAKQQDQQRQERLDHDGLRSKAHDPEPFLADPVKRVRGVGHIGKRSRPPGQNR